MTNVDNLFKNGKRQKIAEDSLLREIGYCIVSKARSIAFIGDVFSSQDLGNPINNETALSIQEEKINIAETELKVLSLSKIAMNLRKEIYETSKEIAESLNLEDGSYFLDFENGKVVTHE